MLFNCCDCWAFFSRKMNKAQVSFYHVILVMLVITLAAAKCMSLESHYGSSQFVLQFFVLARWNSFSVAWGKTTTYTAFSLPVHQKWRLDPHWATLSEILHSALIKDPVFSNNLLLTPGNLCCESLQQAKHWAGAPGDCRWHADSNPNTYGEDLKHPSKCHWKSNWGFFIQAVLTSTYVKKKKKNSICVQPRQKLSLNINNNCICPPFILFIYFSYLLV